MDPKMFKSKKDLWVTLTLAGSFIVMLYAIYASFHVVPLLAALIVPVELITLWIYFGTYYVLDGDTLYIHCGPYKRHIKVEDIDEISPTEHPVSSPALSLDRLCIYYGAEPPKKVMISPEDKGEFLLAIHAADPSLNRRGDEIKRN